MEVGRLAALTKAAARRASRWRPPRRGRGLEDGAISVLTSYRERIEALERGEWPRGFASPEKAIKALEDEICSSFYGTAEERQEAQVLVFRLTQLRDRLAREGGLGAGW